MLFEVSHLTHYLYPSPVFPEQHIIRLRPKSDISQQLVSFKVHINPEPAGFSNALDFDDNNFLQVWFSDKANEIKIETYSKVETLRTNPFDFIYKEKRISNLYGYEEVKSFLKKRADNGGIHESVQIFAKNIAHDADDDLSAFLPLLNQRLFSKIKHVSRITGKPFNSATTLADEEGSCRDVAVLFIDCCRSLNIPARFVSGYSSNALNENEFELHAWAEVYIPGGGWRGFDPSSGLAVADRHIVLAASFLPENTAPVMGTIRATSNNSELKTHIKITSLL